MKTGKATAGSAVVAFLVILSLIVIDLTKTFQERGFDVALAPALDPAMGGNGRVPFDVLDQGPFQMYLTGYLVSIAALVVGVGFLLFAATSYSRSEEITRTVTRSLSWASFAVLFWGIGEFITHMGNNFAANRLGLLEHWSQISGTTNQSLIVWLILLALLGFVSTLMDRSLKLQEDQEGLV